MDRGVITDLVEDYWRALIPAMQTGGAPAFNDVSQRFEIRIQETAKLLEPIEAASFLQKVEADRERLMAEYTANPVALKQRLGISLGIDARKASVSHSRNDLGGLVVRTAVRATIWESIWALFRSFR